MPTMKGAQSTNGGTVWLQPATLVLPKLPAPLPAGMVITTLSSVGAPFNKLWGFLWCRAEPMAWPVSEAWLPFAESSFPQTPPHPPHPGASEGLSPTLSWQPPGYLSVFLL